MRGARPTLVPTAAALASPTVARVLVLGSSRTVDNIGRSNCHVVFEFSQQVVVDKTYLDYVVRTMAADLDRHVTDPIRITSNLSSTVW